MENKNTVSKEQTEGMPFEPLLATIFERKIQWLREWSEKNDKNFDVLNQKLVDDYTDEFNVSYKVMPFGANICRDLGRTLGRGYKEGILERGTVGLHHAECGFPKWVYSYSFYGG